MKRFLKKLIVAVDVDVAESAKIVKVKCSELPGARNLGCFGKFDVYCRKPTRSYLASCATTYIYEH